MKTKRMPEVRGHDRDRRQLSYRHPGHTCARFSKDGHKRKYAERLSRCTALCCFGTSIRISAIDRQLDWFDRWQHAEAQRDTFEPFLVYDGNLLSVCVPGMLDVTDSVAQITSRAMIDQIMTIQKMHAYI